MKVLVLGAGVIGVTTAWYLAKAGVQVEVVDRQPGPGLETSFANGGQISPCHAEPWANPSAPAQAWRWMGRADAPLLFGWRRWDPSLWSWGLRFLANCPAPRALINLDRALRVALYSRFCLQALRRDTGIAYDQKTLGILHIYRDRRDFDHAADVAARMGSQGLLRQIKTADQAIAIEPALSSSHATLAGAIYTPDDESGDAHKFTAGLAALCAGLGVAFRYDCEILGLEGDAGKITGVATVQGRLKADNCVLALGSWSPILARQVGLTLPIYPAKGYSATIAVADPARAPSVSITDDAHRMVFSRLGERLRCAGTAELTGWNASMNERRARMLLNHASRLFPGAGDYAKADLWAGLRPVTPDSVPILGRTSIGNLFLNTGHGTLGWTMCCGSGKILADLITGRPPDIDMSGLGLDRFSTLSSLLSAATSA